jgi:hypothetical protein
VTDRGQVGEGHLGGIDLRLCAEQVICADFAPTWAAIVWPILADAGRVMEMYGMDEPPLCADHAVDCGPIDEALSMGHGPPRLPSDATVAHGDQESRPRSSQVPSGS